MLRVLRIARDEGISAYGSPTATSPTDATLENRVEATLHELGGLTLYFVDAARRPERGRDRRPDDRCRARSARTAKLPVLPLGPGDRRAYTPANSHRPGSTGNPEPVARRAP